MDSLKKRVKIVVVKAKINVIPRLEKPGEEVDPVLNIAGVSLDVEFI
jgi:hypothetical protein